MGDLAPTRSSRPARRRAEARRADVPTSLADALFATTPQQVLVLSHGRPSRRFFASELTGSGAVQREPERLSSSGLVTVTRIGQQERHQANLGCPLLEELRGLAGKTVAMVQPVRQALEPLGDRAALAGLHAHGYQSD